MNKNIQIDYTDSKIKFFSSFVKDKRVLDIGVVQHDPSKFESNTWLHRMVVKDSSYSIGIDIDENGVNSLKNLNYNVVLADAQNFDLGEKFDVIVAGDIIEHLGNVGLFFESVKRHLSSDGLFLISTPNPFNWATLLRVLAKGSAEPNIQHTCWFCEKTLDQLLHAHGFKISEVLYGDLFDTSFLTQRLIRLIGFILPLPYRLKKNTILISAKSI